MHSFLKAQRGFTLLELMLTVGVMAVLLGLAIPSFLETVRNNRLIGQNNEFIGSLNFARSEALKRSDAVTICASADQATCSGAKNWSTGRIAFADINANGDLDGGETVLQTWPSTPQEFTLNAANGSFVRFGSSGMSSGAETFDLIRTNCVGMHARRIDVSIVGRVSTTVAACP